MLETLAQCLALWYLGSTYRGEVLCFNDNTASQHALIKGYSSDEATNAIISLFWQSAASRCVSPWIVRVSSEDNIADEISRGDFARARRLSWQEVKLPLGSIWPVLLDAIESRDGVARHHVEAIHGYIDG